MQTINLVPDNEQLINKFLLRAFPSGCGLWDKDEDVTIPASRSNTNVISSAEPCFRPPNVVPGREFGVNIPTESSFQESRLTLGCGNQEKSDTKLLYNSRHAAAVPGHAGELLYNKYAQLRRNMHHVKVLASSVSADMSIQKKLDEIVLTMNKYRMLIAKTCAGLLLEAHIAKNYVADWTVYENLLELVKSVMSTAEILLLEVNNVVGGLEVSDQLLGQNGLDFYDHIMEAMKGDYHSNVQTFRNLFAGDRDATDRSRLKAFAMVSIAFQSTDHKYLFDRKIPNLTNFLNIILKLHEAMCY